MIQQTETQKSFFGRIIAAIGGFIGHLFTGAKNAFNDLSPEQKDAIIQGVNISELIKTGYAKGEDFIVTEVANIAGVDKQSATQFILTAFKDMGINATVVQDGLNQLSAKIQSGITDNNYNGLWQTLAGSLAQLLSTGSLNWVSLSMGLVEWAFLHFVKSKR